jgi:CHAT domain-containing protein
VSLVIVPDLELWGLPFQALIDRNEKYLVQDHPISYSHSVTVIKGMRAFRKEKTAVGTLLALGNPQIPDQAMDETRLVYRGQLLEPLPETETEVNLLEQLYGPESSLVLTGENASEAMWKREAGNYKVLHLATHGILNSASPLYSHVILSKPPAGSQEDGLLEAWEILQMDLSAGLVVLSACETALGRIGAGEGMIGLSWAFFVAGSDATVVSQWKVETESTSALMIAFHKNLKNGQSRARALQSAAREVSGNEKYRHPFYWAGFVVIGDPS